MTVAELLTLLSELPDKSMPVTIDADGTMYNHFSVEVYDDVIELWARN